MRSLTLSVSLTLPTFLLLPLIASSYPVEPTQPACGSCLIPSEIIPIATRWLKVFATGGLADLPNAATENVQYWNEEFTYPDCPTPYANNRSELWNVINGSAQNWTACTDITFEIVSTWSSCDRIAVRWRENGYASKDAGKSDA